MLPAVIALFAVGLLVPLVVRRERRLRRARDAAEASTRAKGELLAMMSHEIRTPMSAVIGMAELLQRTRLDERQARYLSTLRSSATSLLGVINDVLDLSKIEAGRLELRRSDFDLRDVVEEVASSHAGLAQQKHLELVCDVPTGLPTRVRGDADRLRQVLINLVSNAIKFTDVGEIAVRVRAAPDDLRPAFELEVVDTGIGMTVDEQAKAFVPFWQADGANTRQKSGTGLGLAIASRLVAMMGSRLELSSTLGQGTRFGFRLVLEPAKLPAPAAAEATLPPLRVLVVDDNATNRLIVSEQLQAWGLTTTLAEGGARAVVLWHEAQRAGKPFQLVLLDGHMPGMSGFDVAQRLRALDQGGLKVVMLTSIDTSDEQAGSAQLDDWLTKPVRQVQLFDCIARLFAPGPAPRRKRVTVVPPSRHARILLVDDNEINQAVVAEMLGELGLDVALAGNGAEAVAAVEREDFELIFMDCQMPVLDGYAATAQIRRLEGEARHTTIVALSAHALGGDRELGLAAGMDDYLVKPVTVETLVATLDRWLGAHVAAAPAAAVGVGDVLDPTMRRARRFVEMFLELAPKDVANIQAAGDGGALRDAAHRLKGSAFALGLRRLGKTCEELERLGRDGDFASSPAVVARIGREFEATCRALQEELAEQHQN